MAKTKQTPQDIKPIVQKISPDDIITKHVYWSVATGLIPIPLLDIAAVTAVQLDMVKQIANHYNCDYSEVQGKSWISALTTATLSSFLARAGASAIKVIPAIGTAVGMASMAILSGASTYAIGKVFVKHFDDGGTFNDFNVDAFKDYYKQQVEVGKEFAEKIRAKFASKEKEAPTQSSLGKLRDLETMRAEKLVSEEEYQKLKAQILKEFTE